jgi:hypothetical protein
MSKMLKILKRTKTFKSPLELSPKEHREDFNRKYKVIQIGKNLTN